MNLRPFVHRALPEALNLIRSIVNANPKPLRTRELYDLAVKSPVDGTVKHILRPKEADPKLMTLPPHPEHPIRSLSYLKRVVLPTLERENFIKKEHTIRQLSADELATRRDALPKSARKAAEQGVSHEWLWELKGPMPIQRPQPPAKLDVKDIAFGADISHLSKRRQRSRQKANERDLQWVVELEQARREGARARAIA